MDVMGNFDLNKFHYGCNKHHGTFWHLISSIMDVINIMGNFGT